MNAAWERGMHGDDPPQWIDLDERTQVQLCCDVIEGDDGWLSDALTELKPAEVVELLRTMNDTSLGLKVRATVMEFCRKEVERRLECGDFLP